MAVNEGSQASATKRQGYGGEEEWAWQGGGWGLGHGDREVVIRKRDRDAVEEHVWVKEGRVLWWGPGWEIPKNTDVSPNDSGILEGKQAGQTLQH